MKKTMLAWAFLLSSFSWAGIERTAQKDLLGWRDIMEMFIMDDGHYPEITSIESLAQEVYARQYSEQIVIADPEGRLYQVNSSRSHYRISAADGAVFIENGFDSPKIEIHKKPTTSQASFSIPTPRSPDTALYVSKSGNDIKLDWTGAGTQYDGTAATNALFSSVRTLFIDSTSSTFTYTNGLLKTDETFLCFDVTDEVETNHGGYWNGGLLPPPPPTIDAGSPSTNIGSLYVGSSGSIAGTGFSNLNGENLICFDGGVCTHPTSSTSTLLSFTTPPGAVSGDLTVNVADQSSEAATAFVTLEDPTTGWNIRTIGFSSLTGEYWMAGLSGVNSIWRVYYNSGTGKWTKSDQKGGMAAQVLYCSGKTTRTGRLYCGYGTTGASGGTRYVDTSPVGTLTTCIGLGGSGANVNVRGAAADPNPSALGGRDVAYFAWADTGASSYRIKKVAADCSSVLDADYGNYNWNGQWGSIVGMSVDPVNGDLYVASTTNVYKIDSAETITAIKGGFTSIYDVDIFHQSTNDPGFLLIADAGTGGAGSLKAIALDNTSSTPMPVASISNMRAATWGGSVFSQSSVVPANIIRSVVMHNNGNSGAVNPIRTNPFIGIAPSHPASVWISAPSPCYGFGGPSGQDLVVESKENVSNRSKAKVEMWYKDGISRYTCALTGDPQSIATYEAAPADPLQCDKPRLFATSECDNKDSFSASWGGVGSIDDTQQLYSCSVCGGTGATCKWTFYITKQFAGDNYKVFFIPLSPPSTGLFYSASFPYVATKHIHLEPDRMCRNGGILKVDAITGNGTIYLAMKQDGTRADTVNQNDIIDIFDATNTYEGNHDSVCVKYLQEEPGQLRVRIDLGNKDNCSEDCTLNYDYDTDSDGDPWDYTSGKGAGVCVNDASFYLADPSGLSQPFSDAFVTYHYPSYGAQGAGVIPYMPLVKLLTYSDEAASLRHHQIWYTNKLPDTIDPCYLDPPSNTQSCPLCCNKKHNHNHIIGAKACDNGHIGDSLAPMDISWIYVSAIETDCTFGSCTGNQLPNYIRQVTAHECGHHFNINCPPDYHDLNEAWCDSVNMCGASSTQHCIMNLTESDIQDRTDGVDHFCSDNLFHDPVTCGSGETSYSIRTVVDPL